MKISELGEASDPDDYEYCEEMLAAYEQKLSDAKRQIEALQEWRRLLERQIDYTKRKKIPV